MWNCFFTLWFWAPGDKQLIKHLITQTSGIEASRCCCIYSWSWGDGCVPKIRHSLWGAHHPISASDSRTHLYLPLLGLSQDFPGFPYLSRPDLLFLFDGISWEFRALCGERSRRTQTSESLPFTEDHSVEIVSTCVCKHLISVFISEYILITSTGLLNSFLLVLVVFPNWMWPSTLF